MKALLYIFIGGGLGALVRYGISILAPLQAHRFPWATLIANVLAALVVGWAMQASPKTSDPQKYLFLVTGFCGGLSTFSTFSLETIQLLQRGDLWSAGWNIGLNVLLSLLAVAWLAQRGASL